MGFFSCVLPGRIVKIFDSVHYWNRESIEFIYFSSVLLGKFRY